MSDHLARHLTTLLKRLEPGSGPELDAAIDALFKGLHEGHVCLDRTIEPGMDSVLPALRTMREVVGIPGEFKPLIIDGDRLFLARYWKYETDVAQKLRGLAGPVLPKPDPARVTQALQAVFGTEDLEALQAARGSTERNLVIISGGPGTGKTTTVAQILAVRQMLAAPEQALTICLAAPTGKAADRLRESVSAAKHRLPIPETIRQKIPEEAFTLHRLLGMSAGIPRRNRENPLRLDLLVIDEASMIDLSLMAKVLDALPRSAGLILLGDRDQLDAVQPGSVFGDLCRAEEGGALRDNIFSLTKSYRFESSSGIGVLAQAVKAGDADAAIAILRSDASGQIAWIETRRPEDDRLLLDHVSAWLRPYFEVVRRGAPPGDCFEAFNRYRLLTPLREGPANVGMMNERIVEWLRRDNVDVSDWYPGRPLLVDVNSYALRLFNGDVGITLPDQEGKPGVVFAGEGGTWRRFSPARLPSHEPAYALTVHKSQGSEFDTVLLLIPPGDNPVVTRNLLYTGITRARKRCLVWGSEKTLREAVARKPRRASGLGDRLASD